MTAISTAHASLLDLRIPIRLAVQGVTDPLIVPLWFEYRDERLWCASQADSRCVRALRRAGRCAFDISTNDMPYRGLRGTASVICDASLGAAQLDRLLQRYLGGLDSPLARRLRRRADNEVAVIIEPVRVSHWDYAARMRGSLPVT